MPISLSVLVFRGDPVDSMEYCHAGIYLEYGDGKQSTMHIVGAPRVFHFEEEVERDLAKSDRLERQILVTTLHKSFSRAMIQGVCSKTRVKNDGSEWNCQHWVGDVLTELMKLEVLIKDREDIKCLMKEQKEIECRMKKQRKIEGPTSDQKKVECLTKEQREIECLPNGQVKLKCLTKEQRMEAIDRMTTAISEAKDEKHLCVTMSGWT
ncbi:hypothetical protein ASPCADRAFT_128742 [Aspergillus carbonarius ITEM 5010]|uniref:Uncharacterized protein n=1 Tax=Aspergillus carbonarius (strain ITEM 5010) TaxID=602072 RepID=A0A1R3RRB5_ASPC5|nr:hypothetical protein ASPCADRAFT_128742 [Aspergillus carbonarius ITEM 5010]